ncbi:zinc ABC transporter substrate-binding protein [Dongshaea marina]|uniref:zinc ABC transporter substrate-binding protein n=1 Tax=Dongshaea marina TaxID=2047966 RepID=UPI00190205FE|nr:zinc ABC transporter substrate-binding protein [Dongshaea marina]
MEGVNQPELLIPAEASPHQYSLRPSQARALSNAQVVFWMGEGLTPWLEKAMVNVAGSAQKIEMLEVDGTTRYQFREGASFEGHSHHQEEISHSEEHHDHQADENSSHHHEQHDHQGVDPHAWLDPENAKVWVVEIKRVLSEQDPEHAVVYEHNANKTIASLDQLIATTGKQINGLGKPKFIVFHDAYQYFEKRFKIPATGSISLSDAEDPSPARIAKIRTTVNKLGVSCIFTEPQFNPGLVNNVFEGTKVSVIGVIDPLGANIKPGNEHYTKLIQAMANSLSQCKQ